MDPSRLQSFAAIFTVADVTRALSVYVGRLGFVEQFRVGEPPSYAIIDRDNVSLHLMAGERAPDNVGRSAIYVFVDNADGLHAEFIARACPIEEPPADYDYGMREFSLRDPDGNRITFGQEIPRA